MEVTAYVESLGLQIKEMSAPLTGEPYTDDEYFYQNIFTQDQKMDCLYLFWCISFEVQDIDFQFLSFFRVVQSRST